MPESIWLQDQQSRRFPAVTEDLSVDVVVIGAGITGATAAFLLKGEGLKVALVERGNCGGGETGHTTAHLTYVIDKRPAALIKDFGRDHARAVWDAGLAAIGQIDSLAQTEGIDCDFAWTPAYLHLPWDPPGDGADSDLKTEAAAATELGFAAHFVERAPLVQQPAVHFANQARIHPTKYVRGLAGKIAGNGSHVFEQSDVSEIEDDPCVVHVGPHRIRCDYLVVATHVPLQGKTGLLAATLLQTKLSAYSTYAIAAELPAEAVPQALFWDTANPYHYLRVERHADRTIAIFGGEDHKTGQVSETDKCFQRLEQRLRKLLPQAKVIASWSGQVIETPDGLPYIGETAKKQFIATGFSGNGMTFGTLAGMMACDAAKQRKNPWQTLFSPERKKLSGAWNYLLENVDFPYYMLKDRLTATEDTSPADLGKGAGAILHVNGQRTAVYRDEQGKLTSLSPVCPHMGCLVHWNKAESTWDCPCHGSRFKPTGEILAGPTEKPLSPQPNSTASAS